MVLLDDVGLGDESIEDIESTEPRLQLDSCVTDTLPGVERGWTEEPVRLQFSCFQDFKTLCNEVAI